MTTLDDDLIFDESEFADTEELRRKIRAAIEKMDKPQLEILWSIAMLSASDKDKELFAMLNPPKARRRKKK